MSFLDQIKARKTDVEVFDSDTEVNLKTVNLCACGSGHHGRLAQGFKIASNLHKFTTCHINAAVFPNIRFKDIACGAGHVLAISEEQQIFSWGKCHFGQLGHGEKELDRYLPRRIKTLENNLISKIAAQDSGSFAITTEGKLYSWGCGYFGALGSGNENSCFEPQLVNYAIDVTVVDIFAGKHHAATITGKKIIIF